MSAQLAIIHPLFCIHCFASISFVHNAYQATGCADW